MEFKANCMRLIKFVLIYELSHIKLHLCTFPAVIRQKIRHQQMLSKANKSRKNIIEVIKFYYKKGALKTNTPLFKEHFKLKGLYLKIEDCHLPSKLINSKSIDFETLVKSLNLESAPDQSSTDFVAELDINILRNNHNAFDQILPFLYRYLINYCVCFDELFRNSLINSGNVEILSKGAKIISFFMEMPSELSKDASFVMPILFNFLNKKVLTGEHLNNFQNPQKEIMFEIFNIITDARPSQEFFLFLETYTYCLMYIKYWIKLFQAGDFHERELKLISKLSQKIKSISEFNEQFRTQILSPFINTICESIYTISRTNSYKAYYVDIITCFLNLILLIAKSKNKVNINDYVDEILVINSFMNLIEWTNKVSPYIKFEEIKTVKKIQFDVNSSIL